ncbi:MAG: hypothetical protein ACTSPK_10990 [Candidatus Heimdallarchaeota archaeon]
MKSKIKLFQKITLENLMLHEHTKVDFAKEPITLITGANGSGKTQVLDGVIICIGYTPGRSKAKGIGSLVGKNGDHAKVTLEMANPIIDGRRTIQTLDNDLNAVINSDIFKITAKVSKEDSNIIYSLNNSRKIIRGRMVTRGDIRRIFESIGVRGDNRLAFTGEGTVDEFASKSARRKLDVLLEVTGLKQYREEVISSQETLKASIQEIEPIKRKHETERKLLTLWNDALNILKQKKNLMQTKTKLETELAWSYVEQIDKRLESLNKERLKILKQRSDNEHAIYKIQEEITVLKNNLEVLDEEYQLIEEQERVKDRKAITLETQLEYEVENIKNFEREIYRYVEQRKAMEKIIASKDLSEKDRKLRDKQEILFIKTKKLSLVQGKYLKAEKELLKLKQQVTLEPDFNLYSADDEVYSSSRLTKYEQDMVIASKRFKQIVSKKSIADELLGPIISLIHIKDEHKGWETGVKNIIGKNLYAFIAKTDNAYRLAKRIYDETWPRWKPPISVFKVSAEDAKKANTIIKKPQYKEIYAAAMNLIDGNPYAVGFLKNMNRNVLAEDKYDPVILTKIAKTAKVNILTKSGKSFFLKQGGFGRPPAPMKNKLGWTIKSSKETARYQSYDDRKTRVDIARLERERRELKIDEIKVLGEMSKLHQEIQALGMPDEKIIGKIETIQEIVGSIEAKIKECEIHKDEIKIELIEAQETVSAYFGKKNDIKFRIKELQGILQLKTIEVSGYKEKDTRLFTLELQFDSDYEKYAEDKKERVVIAERKGDRPSEIRGITEIRDELSRIEGHLDSISISDVDEDKIEAQRIKVDSLKQYMVDREEHITNLRADLDARLAFWNGELREIIEKITHSMRLLLGGIFKSIQLRVTNINKPEDAGLHIEAITKGKDYRDFRELSGGEKVLAIEGLILAMHTLTDSPIHAIDEFTQRLDEKNKSLAFSIAVRTQKLAGENSRYVPQFILLCPEAIDVELTNNINHLVVSELKVMKVEPK